MTHAQRCHVPCSQTDAWLLEVQISEDRSYAVRQPTAHAINENHRVRCFRQMLLGPLESPEQLMNLGDLMYQVLTLPHVLNAYLMYQVLTSFNGWLPHVSGANLMYQLIASCLNMVVRNLAGLYHVHFSQYVM